MTFQKFGGLAGLTCAATYIFGFVVLLTTLAPLGFGTNEIDGAGVVAFIQQRPGFMILWNSAIYVLNALALAVLVVALFDRLQPVTPGGATLTLVLGGIWATLVLGAGMIANVGVERAAQLAAIDVEQAIQLWQIMHEVELGLGGGNEIAGGVWIALVSLLALGQRRLGKVTIALGVFSGAGGLLTVIPALGEPAGAVFGLGAIAWFICVGVDLLRHMSPETV